MHIISKYPRRFQPRDRRLLAAYRLGWMHGVRATMRTLERQRRAMQRRQTKGAA